MESTYQPVDDDSMLLDCFSCTAACWRVLFCLHEPRRPPAAYGEVTEVGRRYEAPLLQTANESTSGSSSGRENDTFTLLPKSMALCQVTPNSGTSAGACAHTAPVDAEQGEILKRDSDTGEEPKMRQIQANKELYDELQDQKRKAKEKLLALGFDCSDLDEDICATCLDPYTEENPKIFTKCNHHFHLACIYEWLERRKTCPLCGETMEFDELL